RPKHTCIFTHHDQGRPDPRGRTRNERPEDPGDRAEQDAVGDPPARARPRGSIRAVAVCPSGTRGLSVTIPRPKGRWLPRCMREAPALDPGLWPGPPRPRHALLLN